MSNFIKEVYIKTNHSGTFPSVFNQINMLEQILYNKSEQSIQSVFNRLPLIYTNKLLDGFFEWHLRRYLLSLDPDIKINFNIRSRSDLLNIINTDSNFLNQSYFLKVINPNVSFVQDYLNKIRNSYSHGNFNMVNERKFAYNLTSLKKLWEMDESDIDNDSLIELNQENILPCTFFAQLAGINNYVETYNIPIISSFEESFLYFLGQHEITFLRENNYYISKNLNKPIKIIFYDEYFSVEMLKSSSRNKLEYYFHKYHDDNVKTIIILKSFFSNEIMRKFDLKEFDYVSKNHIRENVLVLTPNKIYDFFTRTSDFKEFLGEDMVSYYSKK